MDRLIIKSKKRLRLFQILSYANLFIKIGFKHTANGFDGKNYIYIFTNPKTIEANKEYIFEKGFYIIRLCFSGPNQIGISENGRIVATAPTVGEANKRIDYILKIREENKNGR